jgi:FKBP-type peptidyl-prolyl cis-trans isomerase (trigger factor)
MVKHSIKKLPKNTVEITLTAPWEEIQAEYDKSFDELSKELSVEGFRKGKAPKNIAERHLSKDRVYQHLIHALLPRHYEAIVKEEGLKPLTSPRVELVKAKEKEAWEFKITLAEKPTIELKNYKKAIQEATAKMKKADIWVPGQGEQQQKLDEESKKQQVLNTVLAALLKETKCEISDVIIEEELNHRLTKLVDDVQKIGLTIDSYMKSRNTTMEEIQGKIRTEIEETFKLEFVLAEIADTEKIAVEKKDLDALWGHITNEKERKDAEANAYFYASEMRKQKVLDFLMSL